MHSRKRSGLLHLEEGPRGRSNEVLRDTRSAPRADAVRTASDAHRVEEALVERTLPAKGVEFRKEFIAPVHVVHGTQFGLAGLGQPRVGVGLGLHERLSLLHAVLQRGQQPWHRHRLLLLCLARDAYQVLSKLQHAVERHLHHAQGIWIYQKTSSTQIRRLASAEDSTQMIWPYAHLCF